MQPVLILPRNLFGQIETKPSLVLKIGEGGREQRSNNIDGNDNTCKSMQKILSVCLSASCFGRTFSPSGRLNNSSHVKLSSSHSSKSSEKNK